MRSLPLPLSREEEAKLIKVIGDGHADESKWLAACAALGEKSLVKTEPSALVSLWLPLARAVSRRLIALNVLFSIVVFMVLADRLGALLIGVGGSVDWVTVTVGCGQRLSALIAFFGALSFWREFTATKKNTWLPVLWCFASAFILAAAAVEANAALAAVALVCPASVFVMSKLATYLRNTLPPTFRKDRTLIYSGLASAPCAFIMLGILVSILCGTSSSVDLLSNFSWGTYSTLFSFLMLSCALPTYVSTRTSRSNSVASSLALNAFYSAPLLSGLFFAASITSITHMIGLCKDSGALFSSVDLVTGLGCIMSAPFTSLDISLWAVFFAATALTAGTTYLGAKQNGRAHRRKLSRSGRHWELSAES